MEVHSYQNMANAVNGMVRLCNDRSFLAETSAESQFLCFMAYITAGRRPRNGILSILDIMRQLDIRADMFSSRASLLGLNVLFFPWLRNRTAYLSS